jgi:diguanylate cyclase (GGDEF)-like protein/PAS domain S-box-containing protein
VEGTRALPFGDGTDGAPPRRSFRQSQLWHPGQLAIVPVVPLFIVGRQHGWVADLPLWVLVGSLVVAQLATTFGAIWCPYPQTTREVWVRVCIMQVGVGVCIYATGWGATLALGFVFGAADLIRVMGSRAARAAGIVAVVSIIAGEILVATGALPSLLPQPQGHGLAVLEAVGAAIIIALLGWTTSAKERVEESVRRSEQRFRALVQHGSDIIMVIGLDGTVLYVSPSISRALGYDPDLVVQLTSDFIAEADLELARSFFGTVAEGRDGDVAWMELRLCHANGSLRWFEIGVTNRRDDPSVMGMVCNMRDVTERKGIEAELTYRAHHDQLTSLPNRATFLTRLEGAVEGAAKSGRCLAVLFLDVDRFKMVNDSLGHDAGDRLLFDVANRLRSCVRPHDLVARFGGDEFTVLLDGIGDVGGAVAIAQRITETLRAPLEFDGRHIVLSASIGIAILAGRDSADDLLRHADLAMYAAKDKGRSRWELFDAEAAPLLVERLELERALWDALDNDELLVRFQPEFSLGSGDVVAVEALVRWPHPTLGLLEPDDFIPLAEESNLIVALDRYVLREACRCARRWSDLRRWNDRIVVSVNLSARFIRQPDVVADITATLREADADPRCLQIEITERTVLTDLETTVETLQKLRLLGVRIAIDDFGTGYSSLGYLKQLPVDVVKLDRNFVESMDILESDVAIVQAVITMAHALGMKVTAEGVERVEQATRLRRLGCDTAMGWYWTSAVDAEALLDLLRDGVSGDERVLVPMRLRKTGTANRPSQRRPDASRGSGTRNPNRDPVGSLQPAVDDDRCLRSPADERDAPDRSGADAGDDRRVLDDEPGVGVEQRAARVDTEPDGRARRDRALAECFLVRGSQDEPHDTALRVDLGDHAGAWVRDVEVAVHRGHDRRGLGQAVDGGVAQPVGVHDAEGQRGAGRVAAGAPSGRVGGGRERRGEHGGDTTVTRLGDVHLIAVDQQPFGSCERHGHLARRNGVLVERREPLDELSVGWAGMRIADVGGEQATVGQERAAEGRGAGPRSLVRRYETRGLLRRELAERSPGELEHTPADLPGGGIGSVDRDEAARIGGVEADLPADVDAVAIGRG